MVKHPSLYQSKLNLPSKRESLVNSAGRLSWRGGFTSTGVLNVSRRGWVKSGFLFCGGRGEEGGSFEWRWGSSRGGGGEEAREWRGGSSPFEFCSKVVIIRKKKAESLVNSARKLKCTITHLLGSIMTMTNIRWKPTGLKVNTAVIHNI